MLMFSLLVPPRYNIKITENMASYRSDNPSLKESDLYFVFTQIYHVTY